MSFSSVSKDLYKLACLPSPMILSFECFCHCSYNLYHPFLVKLLVCCYQHPDAHETAITPYRLPCSSKLLLFPANCFQMLSAFNNKTSKNYLGCPNTFWVGKVFIRTVTASRLHFIFKKFHVHFICLKSETMHLFCLPFKIFFRSEVKYCFTCIYVRKTYIFRKCQFNISL